MHFVVISIKLFFLCQPSACLKQQRSNTIWKLQLIQQHADPSVAQSALPLCASIYLPLSAPRGDESQGKGCYATFNLPPDTATQRCTLHMAKEYSFCKPLFTYKYILCAINIKIFHSTSIQCTGIFFFFFFKVYLLHNWWLLMTFSKWGKLLMIFKFIFIRVNELP